MIERCSVLELTTREDLDRVVKLMSGFPHPWGIGGGWALDLFLGRETRVHEDLEIILFRDTQHAFREFLPNAGFEMVGKPGTSPQWMPWPEGFTVELPFHQIRANLPDGVQVEALMNERRDGQYLFRRYPALTRPEGSIWLWSDAGAPFLAPEIQLLYKARRHREKDERDFATVTPHLGATQLQWLRDGLTLAHPNDPWLTLLV